MGTIELTPPVAQAAAAERDSGGRPSEAALTQSSIQRISMFYRLAASDAAVEALVLFERAKSLNVAAPSTYEEALKERA